MREGELGMSYKRFIYGFNITEYIYMVMIIQRN